MATTRKRSLKSSAPRLSLDGPSRFLPKLDPWFVGFAQHFKEQASASANGSKRIARQNRVGEERKRTKRPPPAVLPGFPRTIGEMLALPASWGNPRFKLAMQAVQQRIPSEALARD